MMEIEAGWGGRDRHVVCRRERNHGQVRWWVPMNVRGWGCSHTLAVDYFKQVSLAVVSPDSSAHCQEPRPPPPRQATVVRGRRHVIYRDIALRLSLAPEIRRQRRIQPINKKERMPNHLADRSYQLVEQISKYIMEQTAHKPKIGIICGSGLAGLADKVEDHMILPYRKIPEFPVSTVQGHVGELVFGTLKGKSVMIMKGRLHGYEGYPLWKVGLPVRVMKLIGVQTIIVTNAAGGLNPEFNIGDIMVIKDHLNLPGMGGNNPLVGPNDERFGPRFPPLSSVYNRDCRQLALDAAGQLNCKNLMKEGVYAAVGGPNFETVAECKFLRNAGADAVGMSTVPEVLMAAHCGIKVLGLSLITNKCALDYDILEEASHKEVLEAAQKHSLVIQDLVAAIVEKITVMCS